MRSNNPKQSLSDLTALTDEQLVQRARSGDANAEEVLLRRYKNLVRIKARTYFLMGADTDDIIQEGMFGLYKATRDYSTDKHCSFKTFAELCITRQIITAIKAASRNKHIPLNSYISLNKPVFENDNEQTLLDTMSKHTACDPEEIALMNESMDEISRQVTKEFSTLERNVLQLYLEGYSYIEIANALGKQVKSIDNAVQRIKKKLTQLISSTDNEANRAKA